TATGDIDVGIVLLAGRLKNTLVPVDIRMAILIVAITEMYQVLFRKRLMGVISYRIGDGLIPEQGTFVGIEKFEFGHGTLQSRLYPCIDLGPPQFAAPGLDDQHAVGSLDPKNRSCGGVLQD